MKKPKIKIKNSRNAMLKIFSVVFAIFLWSYVRNKVDPERSIPFRSIPVRFENIAEIKSNNLTVISPKESEVDVKLTGKQSNIGKLKKENVSASINLSGYYAGEYNIPVKIQVDANNIVVDEKEPETIAVKIDENISKKMDVNIRTVGKLDKPYILGNIKPAEEVEVTGPKTYIDSIDRITAKFDITGKRESVVMSSDVQIYDKEGEKVEGVKINPQKINIEIPILKTETVPVKLKYIGNIPEEVDENLFSVEPNSISVKGNTAVINKIKEIETEKITVDKLLKGETAIELNLPEGIVPVDKDISFIASAYPIEINKQLIEIPVKNIKIKNLDKNYAVEYENEDQKIRVTLSSKDPLSNVKISAEDVYASIDVSNLNEGNHKVKLDISVPEAFRINRLMPEKVSIKINKNKFF